MILTENTLNIFDNLIAVFNLRSIYHTISILYARALTYITRILIRE